MKFKSLFEQFVASHSGTGPISVTSYSAKPDTTPEAGYLASRLRGLGKAVVAGLVLGGVALTAAPAQAGMFDNAMKQVEQKAINGVTGKISPNHNGNINVQGRDVYGNPINGGYQPVGWNNPDQNTAISNNPLYNDGSNYSQMTNRVNLSPQEANFVHSKVVNFLQREVVNPYQLAQVRFIRPDHIIQNVTQRHHSQQFEVTMSYLMSQGNFQGINALANEGERLLSNAQSIANQNPGQAQQMAQTGQLYLDMANYQTMKIINAVEHAVSARNQGYFNWVNVQGGGNGYTQNNGGGLLGPSGPYRDVGEGFLIAAITKAMMPDTPLNAPNLQDMPRGGTIFQGDNEQAVNQIIAQARNDQATYFGVNVSPYTNGGYNRLSFEQHNSPEGADAISVAKADGATLKYDYDGRQLAMITPTGALELPPGMTQSNTMDTDGPQYRA
jgi:hypothetical protein